MENIVTLSIGLGLVVSLMFSEVFGLASGGMVVPGYIALYIHKPLMIIVTLTISVITYFIVHTMSTFIIIYGRRRTILMIITGFILGWFAKFVGTIPYGTDSVELNIVGYIIPGLIAIWIDRQGILETISTLITSSIIVRLILILVFGMEIIK